MSGARTLLIIHGVGDCEPGATLLEAARGLAAQGIVGTRADLVIEGEPFPRLMVQHLQLDEIIEVNWSDVARPARSLPGILDYWTRIILALLAVASASCSPGRAMLTRAYLWSFQALLAYCIYPPLVSLLCVTLAPGSGAGVQAIGLTGFVVVGTLTWYLSRFSNALRAGWLWAISLPVGATALTSGMASAEQLVTFATYIYATSQLIVGTLLALALVETLLRRYVSMDRRVTTMALLYFPFFALSTVGAVIWFVALAAVGSIAAAAQRFEQWQLWFSQALQTVGYDLALIEFTFGGLVALVALGMLCVVASYLRRAKKPAAGGRNAGEFARDAVKGVLAAGAGVFAVLSIVYATASLTSFRTELSQAALWVYGFSSLRFIPYLPLMIGPLAFVAGIVVDVLFYITNDPSISTAAVLRRRLGLALDYVRSRTDAPIILAAHSQGSVIAVDVVGRESASLHGARVAVCLTTAGSPVFSLYERFLGSTPESRAQDDGCAFAEPPLWLNFSREGDYIGAKQHREGVEEINLGIGGHTGYWTSNELWSKILRSHPLRAV